MPLELLDEGIRKEYDPYSEAVSFRLWFGMNRSTRRIPKSLAVARQGGNASESGVVVGLIPIAKTMEVL